MSFPTFLWPLATPATPQMKTGAFLIRCWLWRGLKSDRNGRVLGRNLRFDWLRRRTWRAACDECGQAGRGFFRRPVLKPRLLLFAGVTELRVPRLLVALGTLFVRSAVLPIPVVVWAILPEAAVLLWTLRIARLAFCIRLRSRIIRSHRGLLLAGRRAELRWRRPLRGRCEAIGNAAKVVVIVAFVRVLRLVLRPDEARLSLLLGKLSRCDQAEVMLRVLKVTFSHDRIAGRMGIARKLQVFLCNMVGGAANLDVGPVGFVGPCERIGPFAVVATAHTLVLTWSHR